MAVPLLFYKVFGSKFQSDVLLLPSYGVSAGTLSLTCHCEHFRRICSLVKRFDLPDSRHGFPSQEPYENTNLALIVAFWSRALAYRAGIPGLTRRSRQQKKVKRTWNTPPSIGAFVDPMLCFSYWDSHIDQKPCSPKGSPSAKFPSLASSAGRSPNSARSAGLSKHSLSSTAKTFWRISGFALPRQFFTQDSKPCAAREHNQSLFE